MNRRGEKGRGGKVWCDTQNIWCRMAGYDTMRQSTAAHDKIE